MTHKPFLTAVVMMALTLGIAAPTQAQVNKQQRKERQEMAKMTKKEIDKKASKEARKMAKQYKKEGWQVPIGQPPLEKQIDQYWNMYYEFDETGAPRYIMGMAMPIGEVYDAAYMQAIELAKLNIASQISSEVTAFAEDLVGNNQMTQEQASSLVQTVTASKNLISQSLGRVRPVICVYRVKDNKNKEVLVQMAYDSNQALQATKRILKEEMKDKGEEMIKIIDCLKFGYCPIK